MLTNKVVLMILDGWGIGKKDHSNGVHLAKTPMYDSLLSNYPNATLVTYGEDVGLPSGQTGNSEVGHMNIGAGRIVYQDLLKIDNAIKDQTFFNEKELLETVKYAKRENKKLHLMGLVSKGGVHSSFKHLTALCEFIESNNIQNCFIHAFTDGRDCNPTSGFSYLKELEKTILDTKINIATVIGRYYAMDRDNRWERIKIAYDLLVNGVGEKYNSATDAVSDNHTKNITDEFILPSIIDENGTIEDGDAVICFNFRTDRCREITQVLTQIDMPEHNMQKKKLYYVTMTNYDKTFKNIKVIYNKENLVKTLGEVISDKKLKQLRLAETEKYPHVTYFFNGGKEAPFFNEDRIMKKSPSVKTYDLKPEMSAYQLTDAICAAIRQNDNDFICLNYANPDMVGHTGNAPAIIKACETVDNCLKEVIPLGLENGYSFIIIADHGNADFMINNDGSPNTAHSLNLVPVIVIDENVKKVLDGKLADIAPTVLELMKIEKPKQMTGKSLF